VLVRALDEILGTHTARSAKIMTLNQIRHPTNIHGHALVLMTVTLGFRLRGPVSVDTRQPGAGSAGTWARLN